MFTMLFAFIALFSTESSEMAATFDVDVEKSEIVWSGSKIIGNAHTGTLKLSKGSLELDGDQLTGGSFEIDMTTLKNSDQSGEWKAKLEGHLKSADFFNVEVFPSARFQITGVKSKGNGNFDVTGDLTIKGKTEKINFEAQLSSDKKTITTSATITFDRSIFDVRYGSDSFFDNLGNDAISNDIVLNVTLSINK